MRLRSRRIFLGATAIAIVSLLSAATLRGQAAPAQAPQDNPTLTDEAFKSVVMLKGIPVDTFFEAMGMFASAMGTDCTFCHVSNAYFDKTAFATPTPRIQRARGMIAMMNAINKQYFAGQPRVTCYTCHAGSQAPRSEPDLAQQYGAPEEDPNARAFPVDTRVTADQVFDKYLKAIGGPERLAKFTSFTAKGTYEGFDTAFDKVPVELYGRAPSQQSMVVHMFNGASTRTSNGTSAWMAGPDTPVPLLTLTGGNLEGAKLDAALWFPASIRKAFPNWRVGRTAIADKEVTVVQGLEGTQPRANFYFDENGILIRMVRWTQTPVGFVPTQIDFSDYRDVAGVKMPFHRTVSQTYMQMTVQLSDIQAGAQVDAARFNRPAPAATPRLQ
jgi:photosynthetic reaction center cytochrome c subunit